MLYRIILGTFLGHLLGNYLWAVCISRDFATAFDPAGFGAVALATCALTYSLAR